MNTEANASVSPLMKRYHIARIVMEIMRKSRKITKARSTAMNAEQINAKLFKAKADKIAVYPCRNLRASNLGHPCER